MKVFFFEASAMLLELLKHITSIVIVMVYSTLNGTYKTCTYNDFITRPSAINKIIPACITSILPVCNSTGF